MPPVRVLITGSEGFIGRHLWTELEGHGHIVYGVDRVAALRNADFYFQEDLLDFRAADKVVEAVRPDVVIHLAAQVGREFGEDDIRRTIESNGLMTSLVAKACGKWGHRLIYTSTSEVYGDQAEVECDEYFGPFGLPHNLYGLSKRWGEEAARLYAPEGLTIVRPSMPYGPGVPPGRGRRAMDNMLWQANTGQEIPVHRGAKRSWCWIGDLVAGYRIVMDHGAPVLGGFTAFNIGRDDREVTMEGLARLACVLADAPFDLIKVVDPPTAQTVVKRLSTKRLRELGWEPTVELGQGMPLVFDWIKRFDHAGKVHARRARYRGGLAA